MDSTICNFTTMKTPYGDMSTDSSVIENTIAGAIIFGAVAFATKYVMGK